MGKKLTAKDWGGMTAQIHQLAGSPSQSGDDGGRGVKMEMLKSRKKPSGGGGTRTRGQGGTS